MFDNLLAAIGNGQQDSGQNLLKLDTRPKKNPDTMYPAETGGPKRSFNDYLENAVENKMARSETNHLDNEKQSVKKADSDNGMNEEQIESGKQNSKSEANGTLEKAVEKLERESLLKKSGIEKKAIQKLADNPEVKHLLQKLADTDSIQQIKKLFDSLKQVIAGIESSLQHKNGAAVSTGLGPDQLQKSEAERGKDTAANSEQVLAVSDREAIEGAAHKKSSENDAAAEKTMSKQAAEKKDGDSKTRLVINDKRTEKSEDVRNAVKNNADVKGENNSQGVQLQGPAGKTGENIEVEYIRAANPEPQNITPEGAGGKTQAPVTREAAQAFSKYMKQAGNDQIVKHARFVLKDANRGEIRLMIKPESLGNLKIRLNMNENNIVARILVENNSVRQALESNFEALQRSFNEGGFNLSEMDVSVGGNASGKQQLFEHGGDTNKRHVRLDELEKMVPEVNGVNDYEGTVNLIA